MSEAPMTPPAHTRNRPEILEEDVIKMLEKAGLPYDIIRQVKDYYNTGYPNPPAVERASRGVPMEESEPMEPTNLFGDDEMEGGKKSRKSKKSKKSGKSRKTRKSRKQ